PRLLQEIGAIAFSPFGSDILYALAPWAPHRERSGLHRRALDGSGDREVAPLPEVVASQLSLADGGRRLSFIRYENEADVDVGDLTSAHRAAGPLRRISLSDRNERPSSWSADRMSILTVSDANGGQGVFLQKLDAG